MDSCKGSWLPEQHLQHLSQANSGMSKYQPQSPQRAPSASNYPEAPPGGSQTGLFNPPLEVNHFHFSQQRQWERSVTDNQQTRISCEASSRTQARLEEPPLESSQTCWHQDQKQMWSVHQGSATKVKNSSGESCCRGFTLVSPPSSIRQHCPAGWTENCQVSSNNMVDHHAGPPSKAFTCPGAEQDTKDWPPSDYMTPCSNSGRDLSKYQSFFLAGQFHGFQPGECLPGGVRPVPSCQDEDTSSSDDEGKLIIEL